MSNNRARIIILSDVLSFPMLGNMHWTSGSAVGAVFHVGDLVSIHCAPASKWYLSWLKEVDPNNGWPRYLLESIEDGALCWWENVGLSYYDRERTDNPTWHWNDAQHAFNDRWRKVCRKNDAYIVLPILPDFHADDSVTLDIRIRFGLSDFHNPKTFTDWKHVTMKVMHEYYKESSDLYESSKAPNSPDADVTDDSLQV